MCHIFLYNYARETETLRNQSFGLPEVLVAGLFKDKNTHLQACDVYVNVGDACMRGVG